MAWSRVMGKTRKVIQMEMGTGKFVREWNSAAEAEKEKGYNSRLIPRVCSGKALSANGFWWRYSEDVGWTGGTKTIPQRQRVVGFMLTKDLNFKVSVEFSSKEEAINEGYRSVKRAIRELQDNKTLCYTNGLLFAEKEWFEKNNQTISGMVKLWCDVCGLPYSTERSLASHLQTAHKLSTESYTIRYKGFTGCCGVSGCEEKTRYESFSFKKYCKRHSTLAEREGGAVGGKAAAWNKGKTKYDDERIMHQSVMVTGENNHFFGKEHTEETIGKLSTKKKLTIEEIHNRLKTREGEFGLDGFDYGSYMSRQDSKLPLKCLKCNKTSLKSLQSVERGSLCKFCYPFTVSRDELLIGDYVQSLLVGKGTVKRNDREQINPRELDVYVPEFGFAVEYNGLYWHMDKGTGGYRKELHQEKTELCSKKGIRLFHIFSDEWRENRPLIESMIASRLGLSKTVVGARKCNVMVHSSPVELRDFFESAHISGYTRSTIGFSLFLGGEVVCALTLRKPVNKKYNTLIEIARFATKPHTNVAGGFSKLFGAVKEWAMKEGYRGILSYCDLRFGDGKVYQKAGFELIDYTEISYWYTDGVNRYDRFKFRATQTQTEKEVAKANKVCKIHGCRNATYQFIFENKQT
jgi:hypothetical protein